MISWDRNTRDRILHLLSSPCKLTDTNLHFWVWLHDIFKTKPVLQWRKPVHWIQWAWSAVLPPSKHISGKGFSAAWQFLAKNEPSFCNRNIWFGYWCRIPPCHRDDSVACLPTWVASVSRWQWVGFLPYPSVYGTWVKHLLQSCLQVSHGLLKDRVTATFSWLQARWESTDLLPSVAWGKPW